MRSKPLAVLFLTAALAVLLAVSAGATEIVESGKCGDHLNWTFSVYGVLEITGTGGMWDYSIADPAPWKEFRSEIKTVVLSEGLTSVGDFAFWDCRAISGPLAIPSGVTSIGERAFIMCIELTGDLTIPDSVTSIGECAFSYCRKLGGTLTVGRGVTSIGKDAFYDCEELKEAHFLGNAPASFGSDVFHGCKSGFTIYYASGKTGWTTPEWNGFPCSVEGGGTGSGSGDAERGDLNGDDGIDSNDAILLLRHSMNASRYPINQSGDVNGDGRVDSNDAILLLRHSMDPRRYPLK